MATEVVMPQMGESIAEGTITKWLVEKGDEVERDQPLFEISTDKVDAEIPSPVSGVLLEIKRKEGDTVPVDEVVAVIGEEGEEPSEAEETAAPEAEEKEEEEAAEEPEEEEPEEAEEAEGAAEGEDGEEAEEEEAEEPEEAEETGEEREEPSEADEEEKERIRKYSSPLVRKIAAEEDVDLSNVEGTGIHGRVTKRDIMAYLETREEREEREPEEEVEAPAAAAPAPRARPEEAPAASPIPDFYVPAYTESEEVEIEPMSRIREITAAHMRYSKDTSAHVTTVFHIDMTKVARIRNRAKGPFLEAHGTKLTYMPFIFKAVCAALRKHKKLNAALDGDKIIYKKGIHLGMAVAIDRGLLVPVIDDADGLNLVGLAKTANDLADRARSKKLSPDELKGGTFTITNPGVFGSLFGTPIINQPQMAILGIGAIEKRPIVVTDEHGVDAIAIRTMSYFGITYDHRLVDGADADHFMNDVKEILETGDWPELEPFL